LLSSAVFANLRELGCTLSGFYVCAFMAIIVFEG
jgi:hypothetical protein